jgi:hypothetical protein
MVPRERRRQGRPHVAGVAEAVEQHDRRPMTAGPEMNRCPVIRRDLQCVEVARKRLDLRGRGPRQGECPKEASPKNRRNNGNVLLFLRFSWEAVYACTHTHAHEFSRCVSVVLDAIHGAIAVRADEEPSNDPSPVRPCSPSRLHGRLLAMSLPVEAATPHPLIPPPRREGHPPGSPLSPSRASCCHGFRRRP